MTDSALTPLGFQLVEIMGHQRVAGFVTPILFGGAAFFQVAMPAVEPTEIVLEREGWFNGEYLYPGSRLLVSRPAIDVRLGTAAVFRMTTCTEEQARILQEKQVEILARVSAPAELADGAPRGSEEVELDDDPDHILGEDHDHVIGENHED